MADDKETSPFLEGGYDYANAAKDALLEANRQLQRQLQTREEELQRVCQALKESEESRQRLRYRVTELECAPSLTQEARRLVTWLERHAAAALTVRGHSREGRQASEFSVKIETCPDYPQPGSEMAGEGSSLLEAFDAALNKEREHIAAEAARKLAALE